MYYINDKNCSVPYSCHFVKKCLVVYQKKKKKRKEKKERKKGLILLKNIYSSAKLVKLKVPVIIQDPDRSHIEAIV